jgi:hypothetical protein
MSVIYFMAQTYTFQNLNQLAHSAGHIPYIYDRQNDYYRALENTDMGLLNTSSSTNLDAFGRLRTSTPLTLFDSNHRYTDNNLWNTLSGTGGAVAFNANQGLMDLSTTTASGSAVIRETTKVFAYQAGKSLLTMNTFVMSPAKANLRQRVGYFSTENGMYLELDGTNLSLVKRSLVGGSVSNTSVLQASWNGDKLDGTGPSGLTLDVTKAQILWMDFEWLGVGTVRVGFVINGKFIVCHSFHHANLISSTYITTASLPLRYELVNTNTTATASTLKQICSTVLSEGGYEIRGMQSVISLPVNAPRTCTLATVEYPAISLRLKSNKLDAISILSALNVIGQGNNELFNWKLAANGTTSGGTWVAQSANSAIEYNISGTGFAIGSGRYIAGGYLSSTTQGNSPINLVGSDLFKFQFERNSFTSTPYEISLVVTSKADGGLVYASIDWEEVVK